MFQIIDHTADVGIQVEGATLVDLFSEAAEATYALAFDAHRDPHPPISVPIEASAPALDELLVAWLQECLALFQTRRLVLGHFWIDEIDEKHVVGGAKGRKFDSARHSQQLEIKAVTYHQLEVSRGDDGNWRARVLFDI